MEEILGKTSQLIIYIFYKVNFFLESFFHTNMFINFLLFFSVYLVINIKFLFKVINPNNFLKLYIFLNWPGSVIHELSHYIIALITGNKILEVNLKPVVNKEKKGNFIYTMINMGYVKYRPRYKGGGTVASIAPFFLIPLLFFICLYCLLKLEINSYIIIFYFLFSFLFFFPAMILSKADWVSFFLGIKHFYGIIQLVLFSILYIYLISKIASKENLIFLFENGLQYFFYSISLLTVINLFFLFYKIFIKK